MTRKPRILDLYCGAGGAAVGYHRAGWDVVGVDRAPQPRYPFPFVQMDALDALDDGDVFDTLGPFDAVHASPPCQAYSRLSVVRPGSEWPDLVAATRDRLEQAGVPYVIENVQGAPLRDPVILCGTMFGLGADGFEHRRHRHFELSPGWWLMVYPCQHRLPAAPLYGHNAGAKFMRQYGRGYSIEHKRLAMGIDWMNRDEMAEAIPPAFTEYVGTALLDHVRILAAA